MAELKGNFIIRVMRKTVEAYDFHAKRRQIIRLLKEADIIKDSHDVKKYVDFCYYNQEKKGPDNRIDKHHIIPKCIIKNKKLDIDRFYEGANNAHLNKANHILAHKMLLKITKDEYKKYFESFENM